MATYKTKSTQQQSSTLPNRLLTDVVILGGITAVIYLAAAAYQFGFQDEIGIWYLSLGVEDMVYVARPLYEPLTVILTVVPLVAMLALLFGGRNRRALAQILASIAFPITFVVAFWWRTKIGANPDLVETTLPFLLIPYALLDPMLWHGIFRWQKVRNVAIPAKALRAIQAVIVAFAIILSAHSLGAIDANRQDEWQQCVLPENRQAVLVTMSDDLMICARANVEKGIIYRGDAYFLKVSDAPNISTLTTIPKIMTICPKPADEEDRRRIERFKQACKE